VWESEGKGYRTRLSDDLEWALILVGKFLGRSGGTEEFGFDVCLLTNLEVRWLEASIVG